MDDYFSNQRIDEAEASSETKPWKRYGKKALILLKWIAIGFFGSTLFVEILFIFLNPPFTPLMIKRVIEQKLDGKKAHIEKRWIPIEKISPNMINAVVASEDNRFLDHWGIDVDAIQRAVEYNQRHKRKHGASTITQQVAKNLFLWPTRTWLRKGLEFYFTVTLELIWSKKRIMEVYLNVIETGDGVYGVEAASMRYFHKSASKLTRREAALIAVSLPNPRKRNPAAPSSYLLKRQTHIMKLMNKIEQVRFQ